MPGHIRLPRGDAIENLAGFSEGAWWVQDLAASLPARQLGAGTGRRALDLCSAPGGKTLQLAAAGWAVTSVDASAKRLGRVEQNLARVGLTAQTVTADVLKWEPDEKFEAILLDAPCTATGTCRRHPDVLHRIGDRQIAEMADWHLDFDMTGVSVSDADRQAGSPKIGDKIARNPKNHADKWLVAADYFTDNFAALSTPEQESIYKLTGPSYARRLVVAPQQESAA